MAPLLKETCDPLVEAVKQTLEDNQRENVSELERELATIEMKKKKLLDGWMNSVVSDNDYRIMSGKLEQQATDLKQRIENAGQVSEAPEVSKKTFAIMQQALSNANLESVEIIDEQVRRFVHKIIVKRKEGEETGKGKVPYILEIWLQNAQTPANFDLALCERTRLWQPTKSIFLKKMDFSLQNTKQPVKWSPDVSIHVYLEIS